MTVMPPPDHAVRDVIARALAEDLGDAGDLTSLAVIPGDALGSADVVARAPGTIAGLDAALMVFATVDPTIDTVAAVADGDVVDAGTTLATVTGGLRGILTAERTALNLLGHLSGIATQVAAAVAGARGTGARIADTRKTTPGLRAMEKYAVRCGGGSNHRFGLHDAVMIKDNHLAAVGSIREAVAAARRGVGHTVTIEVEVDHLDQLEVAIAAGADVVLLDNMTPNELRTAVEITAGRCVLEASGGISPNDVPTVAATGVDVISMGWLTHSAQNLDVALDVRMGRA